MDLEINEFYGQTEMNLVVGNCCEIMPIRQGLIKKPILGHRVEAVDPERNIVLPGTVVEIAILRAPTRSCSSTTGRTRRPP